jgi:Ca2+-transporting ATPase
VALGWFAWRLDQGVAVELVRTEVFTLVAMSQWFNVVNCESATRSALRLGVLSNRWLLGGLVASVLLQALVLYVPFMNAMFHTRAIDGPTVTLLFALASAVLWVEEAVPATCSAAAPTAWPMPWAGGAAGPGWPCWPR